MIADGQIVNIHQNKNPWCSKNTQFEGYRFFYLITYTAVIVLQLMEQNPKQQYTVLYNNNTVMYRMWNWSLEGTTTAASASLAGAMWARGLFLNRACAISVNILFCLRAGVKLINRISHFLVLQFTSAIQQSCYFLPYLTYQYRFPCEEPESCSALLCLLWFYQHVRSAQLSGSPCHASN